MESKNTKSYQSPINLVTLAVVFTVISYAQSIVNPLLMAIFTVIILIQPIRWLVKKKVPHWIAVLVVVLCFLLIYLVFFQLLATSLSLFVENSPKYEENLKKITQSTVGILSKMGIEVSSITGSSKLKLSNLMPYTALAFSKLSEIVSREFIFILLTISLLTEFKSISLKMKVHSKGINDSMSYLKSMGDSIRHYLSIKTVTSLCTGTLIAIGLAIIGVDYPILWGLVAFLLNYIPNIGSIIAAIPAVALALIQLGYDGALWTAGIFIVVNIIIGNIVEPKLMGKGLGLSTFVVLFSLIFWGFMLGPIGMFLSVPLTMIIKLMTARNPNTKWIAIILGNGEEAKSRLEGDTDTTTTGTNNDE